MIKNYILKIIILNFLTMKTHRIILFNDSNEFISHINLHSLLNELYIL